MSDHRVRVNITYGGGREITTFANPPRELMSSEILDLGRRIARRLRRSPWLSKVKSVTDDKHNPGSVEIVAVVSSEVPPAHVKDVIRYWELGVIVPSCVEAICNPPAETA